MGYFYWGDKKVQLDAHEAAHLKAAKRLGISTRIWSDNGRGRVESLVGSNSRAGAIIQMAGVLAGGGDASDDYKSALRMAKEAGMTEAQVRKEAKRCL